MLTYYGLLVFLVFVNLTNAIWYNDIVSPEGWQFGEGMVFHIEDTKLSNSSFFDRLALRVNYGNVEISAVQKPDRNAVQLDFFVKNEEEARSKKMGNMLIPFFVGVAKGGAVALTLSALKLFALKALLLAKIALFISLVVIASKYMKKAEPGYVDFEQHAASEQYPVYTFPESAPGSYDQPVAISPYHAYAPSEAVESSMNYATVVEATVNNGSVAGKRNYLESVTKKRDQGKRKVAPSLLTIRHYSRPGSGLI